MRNNSKNKKYRNLLLICLVLFQNVSLEKKITVQQPIHLFLDSVIRFVLRRSISEKIVKNSFPTNSWKKIIVEATAYNEEEVSCEKSIGHPYYGITASGSRVMEHKTIAASTNIPFGTVVFIPCRSHLPNRGLYRVEDRGGAIKKNRIDIYIKSKKECLRWGRRKIEIHIAPKHTKWEDICGSTKTSR